MSDNTENNVPLTDVEVTAHTASMWRYTPVPEAPEPFPEYKELCEKGESVDYQSVLDDLNRRDYEDTHREIAPLKKADDATLLDTSNMTLDESINSVISMIKAVIDSNNSDNDGDSGNASDSAKQSADAAESAAARQSTATRCRERNSFRFG